MFICNYSIWIGIIVCLAGVVLLSMDYIKNKKNPSGESKQLNIKKLIAILFIIGGASFAVVNQVAYASCAARSGSCPASFPAGSTGYTCTNEYAQCSWTGNCLTVKGTMPWDSDCECKCTR